MPCPCSQFTGHVAQCVGQSKGVEMGVSPGSGVKVRGVSQEGGVLNLWVAPVQFPSKVWRSRPVPCIGVFKCLLGFSGSFRSWDLVSPQNPRNQTNLVIGAFLPPRSQGDREGISGVLAGVWGLNTVGLGGWASGERRA